MRIIIGCLTSALVLTSVSSSDAQEDPLQMSGKDFADKAVASANRAADMLPFLVDHPDLLRELQRRIQGQRSAMDEAVNPVPGVGVQRTITISPGQPGPINSIDTLEGYPTTISFIDVTGARWPIHWEAKTAVYAKPGDPPANTAETARKDTNAQANLRDDTYVQEANNIAAVTVGHGFDYSLPTKQAYNNSINILTLSPNPRGGMNVMLEGAHSTIPFQLRAAGLRGGEYDAQITVRVLAKGPSAFPSLAVRDDAPVTGSRSMMDMLEGHPPADAVPLTATGLSPDRVRAWRLGKFYYVRTDVIILSPQPLDHASIADASIYQIPSTSVVLISDDDQSKILHLEED